MKQYNDKTGKIGFVFIFSTIIILLFVFWGMISPIQLESTAKNALQVTLDTFGWFYMLSVAVLVGICIYLALSSYGKVKLGHEEDEPEYSFYTWLGMLFSAGVGVGFVFWGVAEPLVYYFDSPPGVTPQTTEAAETGLRYAVYHWALHPWAIFGFIGLVLADVQYRQNQPALISSALYPLIGDKTKGIIGQIIDILAVIATAIGVATTFGLSALQISGGLSYITDFSNDLSTQLVVILIVTGLFMLSAASGLNKGIRILSITNITLAGLLLVFVLLAGPTLFILENFINVLGGYLTEVVAMSFSMYPYETGDWLGGATIFYWAWHISWAPFMGIFIARISKGRTVREFITGVLLVPALLAIAWFATFGSAALYLEIYQGIDMGQIVLNEVELALFTTLAQYPLGPVLSLLAILLIIIFFITSADSASYVLGVMTSKGSLDPTMFSRIVWGILIAGIASVLLVSGGLEGLQAASILAALPFSIIICFLIVALLKSLRLDRREMIKAEKEKEYEHLKTELQKEWALEELSNKKKGQLTKIKETFTSFFRNRK